MVVEVPQNEEAFSAEFYRRMSDALCHKYVRIYTRNGGLFIARMIYADLEGVWYIDVLDKDSDIEVSYGAIQGMLWITKTCDPVWIHPCDSESEEDTLFGSSDDVPLIV
jgi:hypothetical protein